MAFKFWHYITSRGRKAGSESAAEKAATNQNGRGNRPCRADMTGNGERMIDDLQVPDEFLGAFRRLVRRMPVELQTNEAFLQTLVMYLKLGGEKLASQRVEVEKAEFVKAFTIVKRQPTEETVDDESDDEDEDRDDEDRDDEDQSEDMMDSDDEVEDIDPDTIAS